MAVKGNLRCETCSKNLKPRQASEHHKLGHEVWYIDPRTGGTTHRYGERAPYTSRRRTLPITSRRRTLPITSRRRTLPITGEGNEHILEHFKGYQKDREPIVFILYPDGSVKDMRLEEPLLYPIYEVCMKNFNYNGTFPQFLADIVESYFAAAGYELTMAPKNQGQVYDEVVKLCNEGKLAVFHTEEGIGLELTDGDT